MNDAHTQSYELRNVIFAGAAGSFAVSVFFVSIWFLMSRTDYGHLSIISDTVNEMMAYAMFFLMVFASYFIAALAIYYFRERLVSLPSSAIVSVLGSVLFTAGLLALCHSSFQGIGSIVTASLFYVVTLSIVAGLFSNMLISIRSLS